LRRAGNDRDAGEGERDAAEPRGRRPLADERPGEQHRERHPELQHQHGGRRRQPGQPGEDEAALGRRHQGGHEEQPPQRRLDAAKVARQAKRGRAIDQGQHEQGREMRHRRLGDGKADAPEQGHGKAKCDVEGLHAAAFRRRSGRRATPAREESVAWPAQPRPI